jgi:hypothetical protein
MPLRRDRAPCDVLSTVAVVIDRCPFDEASADAALALLSELASVPTFGARWLRKLARDGFSGELTVDVSNVLSLSLSRGPSGAGLPPTEDELRPLQWWAALVKGSVLRSDDRAVLSVEPFPVVERALVDGRALSLLDALAALSAYGYRLPFAVAVALTSASAQDPVETSVRVCQLRGRGGTLDVVELAIPSASDEVRASLARLARSAGTRVALALAFREGRGWGYLEAFNDEFSSENYARPPTDSTPPHR